MDTRRNMPRVFRAAAVAFVGFAMVCGLLILFTSMAAPATAAPLWDTIDSDILVDTTWFYTGSPYIIVTNTVSVLNGAVLTIEPGVEVQFQNGAQLQIPDGKLVAIGTPTQPITFTAQTMPVRGSWEGIIFGTDAQPSTIQYATIEYARAAIQINTGQVPFYVYSSTIRYVGNFDGDPTTGGAIVGDPDASYFSYNRIYSSEVGIYLRKAGSNWIQDNQIYDIDGYGVGLVPSLGTDSSNNHIVDNQIYDCRDDAIRMLGLGSGAKAVGNIVSGNVISNTNGEAIYAVDQTLLEISGNLIHDTALTTTLGTGGTGSNRAAVALIRVDNPDVSDNHIYDNGGSGGVYEGAVLIEDTDSLALTIESNLIRDDQTSGIVYAGANTATNQSVHGNAICVEPRYEIEDRDGDLNADGNWLGTNTPTLGTEYIGPVTVLPTIQLDISPADASIIADGATTTTLIITFNDGAGHVVPPPARDIAVTTSAGTLSTNVVTVDSSGQASLVLTSTSTPATAIVTATDPCGYPVTTTVTFAGYVDLSVSKTVSPPPYSPGGTITYTISYSNTGSAPASGVVLTETIPASTTVDGPLGWTQVGGTNQYTRFVGVVPAFSGPQTASLVVRVDPGLPAGDASFTNVVEIGDDGTSGPDYNPADNIFTLTVSGGNLPDLWVVKNDNVSPGSLSGPMVGALANTEGGPAILQLIHIMDNFSAQDVPEGGLITYTIGYGNSDQGTAPATGVVLSETLPLYTTYAGPPCGEPGGWCQVDATRTYTHFVGGPLYPGTGDYIYFHVRVGTSLPSTVTEVINTVCIYGNENDLLPENNCSTEETDVITGTYDLSVTKVENTICPNPGDALNYQITVGNLGANDATNVVLREVLPANTSPINLPGSGWTDAGGGIYTYNLGVVPSGAITTAQFWVQIDPNLPPSVESITNTVSVQGDGTDSDPSNNSDTLVTPVGTTPDLEITKNDDIFDRVEPGGVISYTVGYVNNSHRFAATNVVITETLPAGTVITGPSTSQWHRVGSTDQYTQFIGTLGPNEAGSTEFVVQVDDPFLFGSEVVNLIEIGGAEAECNTGNNSATEETPVLGADAADLEVSKVDNVPFCAVPGDVIQYTITYTNNSYTIPAENVMLTEMIDTGAVAFLRPSDWSSAGGGTYTRAPGTSTVGPREGGTFAFDVEIADSIPPGQEDITNVVRIDTTTDDWYPDNDVFTLTTYVPEWPDLFVVKNDNVGSTGVAAMAEIDALISRLRFSPEALSVLDQARREGEIGAMAESVDPGDTITYTIILGNFGRVPANGVVLTDTLPAGTTFAGPGDWQQVGSSNQYIYSLNDPLDAGHGGALRFIVLVDDPFLAGDRVINTVEIGGNEQECNTDDNTSTDETPVTGATPSGGSVFLPLILKNYPEGPPEPPPTSTPTPAPLAWVSDVAVDPATDRVFVASPRQDQVHVIDGLADAYHNSVAVGHGPTGLAVLTSASSSKVFAAHAYAYDYWRPGVWLVDASSLTSHSMTDQGGYVGAAPIKVAVDSSANRAYVSNYFDRMAILGAVNENLIASVPEHNFQASYGIDVSEENRLTYIAARDTGELIIFDGVQAEADPANYGPCHHAPPGADNETTSRILRMVAVNEATGHVFATSPPDPNKSHQTDSKVFVLDEATLLAETARHGGRPSAQTCLWNFGITGNDIDIAAIPGPAWVATLDLPGAVSAGEEGIAVNPVTGRVYVTDGAGDQLFVLQDSTTPAQISLVTTVGVGDNPQGVGVNVETDKVYVANARNPDAPYGTLSVVDGDNDTLITTINLAP